MVSKTLKLSSEKRKAAKEGEDYMQRGLEKLRKLVESGEAENVFRHKTLNDFSAGTIFQADGYKKVKTKIGMACLVDVKHEQFNTKTGRVSKSQFPLMIAERFGDDCENKLPCLLYYAGKKNIDGGKTCHQLTFIDPNDKVLNGEDEEVKQRPTFGGDDDDDDADDDDDEQLEIVDHRSIPCESCIQNGRTATCYGHCTSCGGHQPRNGSQCRCLIR
jgi:hypothetical protein